MYIPASCTVFFLRLSRLFALLALSVLPITVWAQATLENPQPGSAQSGIGLISGWVCTASRIDIEIDGVIILQAAYGTARSDTISVCGKADNGFGLLVNWNLLRDGTHTVRALKDGVEFARVSFTVATLGLGDFPRGLSGNFTLTDFPQVGRSTRIQWQESVQSFVITNPTGNSTGSGSASPETALENPAPASFQSGIGLIPGWACSANRIDIEIDGRFTFQAAYGTVREDTRSECGDTNNGFGLLVNWNMVPIRSDRYAMEWSLLVLLSLSQRWDWVISRAASAGHLSLRISLRLGRRHASSGKRACRI